MASWQTGVTSWETIGLVNQLPCQAGLGLAGADLCLVPVIKACHDSFVPGTGTVPSWSFSPYCSGDKVVLQSTVGRRRGTIDRDRTSILNTICQSRDQHVSPDSSMLHLHTPTVLN